jgi:formate dehydrogenase subunit gamma
MTVTGACERGAAAGDVPAWRRITFAVLLLLGLVLTSAMPASAGTALAQEQGAVPGNTLGNASDTDFWRAVRRGNEGTVAGGNPRAGVMIQSEGELWRAARNGPLSTYGVWILVGMIALLALFFLLRGRIRIEEGRSGREIERFKPFERFVHWLTATSFVVLALTGLNLLYGRYALLPVLGPDIFSAITIAGKYAHNYLAFAFMLGLVLMFLIWVLHNIPNRHDLVWLAKGGGMFKKGVHPPAKKFNAGQKIIFWVVILGGLSLSLSGVALLFPFQFSMFADTFQLANDWLGTTLPADLTAMQEQQLSLLWHATVGVIMTAFIFAHISIGTIGMEGAFDAMGNGLVDVNWAREHHDLWVQEVERREGRLGDAAD